MTTSFASPLPAPIPSAIRKKRVLLVDTSQAKRDLRAEVMRRLGIEVDCAADIPEARCWWKADFYDLVLIDMEKGPGHRDQFCDDVRGATPPQRLAFLVGKPQYLADSPGTDEEPAVENSDDEAVLLKARAALPADFEGVPQRWGILGASQRISAVRSAAVARIQALGNRPAPPRDFEGRTAKRTTTSATLDELAEELQ
jgi:CheY-like chemotaxis protein